MKIHRFSSFLAVDNLLALDYSVEGLINGGMNETLTFFIYYIGFNQKNLNAGIWDRFVQVSHL